jgi:hypothetical protein
MIDDIVVDEMTIWMDGVCYAMHDGALQIT